MATLYVVATPIGNLSDLTPRAKEALIACDLIAAEDTRVTMKLTQLLGIKKPMISCHRHNEDTRSEPIIEKMLAEDLTVCLTCDAGTPGISDPGEALVAAAWEAGIRVIPLAGASAVPTALSVAGFEAREFAFWGFLPREKKALKEKLLAIRQTLIPVAVMYESPHRIVDLVSAIAETLPGTRLLAACDLTKKYELLLRGDANEVLTRLRANPNVEKGEYAVVADFSRLPMPAEKTVRIPAEAFILSGVLDGQELADACRRAQAEGYPRNDVYRAKLRIAAMFETV